MARSSFEPWDDLPPDIAADYESLRRRRAIQDALLRQAMQPLPTGQMVGRFFVPTHPLQGAAQLANLYLVHRGEKELDEETRALGERYALGRKTAAERFMERLQGRPGGLEEDAAGNVTERPEVKPDPRRAIAEAMLDPYLRANPMVGLLAKEYQPVVVGRSLIRPATGEVVGKDVTWADEMEAKRTAELEFKKMLEEMRRQFDLERERIRQEAARERDRARFEFLMALRAMGGGRQPEVEFFIDPQTNRVVPGIRAGGRIRHAATGEDITTKVVPPNIELRIQNIQGKEERRLAFADRMEQVVNELEALLERNPRIATPAGSRVMSAIELGGALAAGRDVFGDTGNVAKQLREALVGLAKQVANIGASERSERDAQRLESMLGGNITATPGSIKKALALARQIIGDIRSTAPATIERGAGNAQTPNPVAPQISGRVWKNMDDVARAVKRGEITEAEALRILRSQFGLQ